MSAGRIEAIWLKRAARGVMDPADSAALVTGRGIEGDANYGRSSRQVTIFEQEIFERIRSYLPAAAPRMRRANVMVSGVRLEATRGRVLALGVTRVLIKGETRPCERMDEQCAGLRDALEDAWGGGVHGVVLEGGRIQVGDAVFLEAGAPRETAER